jgi:phosphoribosyl 1,2-cyclic phosphodiesterase
MVDRLLFLGTAGSKESVGKQLRSSGGIVLQSGSNQFFIDPGPGALVLAKALGVNPRANTAILVSHCHLNHCNDINALLDATTLGGEDKHAVMLCSKSVVEGTDKLKPILIDNYKNQLEKVIALEPGKKVGINEVELVATKTKHDDPTCIGFKFYASGYSIGYASDTQFSREIADQYNDVDILVLNVKEPFNGKNNDCLNCDDAVKFLEKNSSLKLAIITHFGSRMIDSNTLDMAREIQRRANVQVISAKDGFSVEPSGFASSVRQQKLKSFSE